MQTLQDTAQFATEQQLQPDETTLQSGFVVDISKGSLSMEAPGLGVWWGWGECLCVAVGGARCKCCGGKGWGLSATLSAFPCFTFYLI